MSSRATSTPRTAVYLLVLLTAGAYLPSPLYGAYQGIFGFSDLMLTLIYAAFAVVSAPALLLFGSTHDAYGSRPVLRLAVIVAGAGSLTFLLAQNLVWLLAGRIAQGIALGAVTGAAISLIVGHGGFAGSKRASLVASVAFVGGTALGPLISGALASTLPGPFAIAYLVHLGLLGYGWVRVQKIQATPGQAGRWRPTWPGIPRGIRAAVGTAAATGFLAWTTVGIFLALGPSLLEAHGMQGRAPDPAGQRGGYLSEPAFAQQLDSVIPIAVGAVIAVVLIFSMLTQVISAWLPMTVTGLMGPGILALALAMLVLAGERDSLLMFLVAGVVAGAGHGFAYAAAAATVDAMAPSHRRGGVTACLYLVFYLGTGLPTIAVGFISLWRPLSDAVTWLAWAGAAASVATIAATLMWRSMGWPGADCFTVARSCGEPRTSARRSPQGISRFR